MCFLEHERLLGSCCATPRSPTQSAYLGSDHTRQRRRQQITSELIDVAGESPEICADGIVLWDPASEVEQEATPWSPPDSRFLIGPGGLWSGPRVKTSNCIRTAKHTDTPDHWGRRHPKLGNSKPKSKDFSRRSRSKEEGRRKRKRNLCALMQTWTRPSNSQPCGFKLALQCHGCLLSISRSAKTI